VRQLQELTRPLNDAIKGLSSRAEIDSLSDQMTTNLLKSHGGMGSMQSMERWQRCTKLAPLDGPIPMTLRMSRSLELFPDGTLGLHLMIDVGLDGVMGSQFNWHRPVPSAAAGTVEAQQMLMDGVDDMADALNEAIEVLVEQMPEVSGS